MSQVLQPSNPLHPAVLGYKGIFFVISMVITTNLFSYWLFGGSASDYPTHYNPSDKLYLLSEASIYVDNVNHFENKIRDVADQLEIPAEWLMAVIYTESRFNAKAVNLKGSGATGLIQFMPTTARDFGTSTKELKDFDHIDQLDYVYKYLQNVRNKYGNFKSLTQLYLGILYPKALEEDNSCLTLFAKPAEAYRMNSGLDEDKDGVITVKDIDRRMKRIFPTAYMTEKDG